MSHARYTIWTCALLLAVAPRLASAESTNLAPAAVTNTAGSDALATTNAPKRVHAFVSGRVQGVGFRAFTTQQATKLKLTGWVKNLADGRVELVAEGPAPDVEKLMEMVGKGPGGARVDNVERKEEPYAGTFKRFASD